MKTLKERILPGLLLLLAATPVSAQTNDGFAGRLVLTGSTATAVSNNLRATHESNEPNHAGSGGARSLWWTWTAPNTGLVNFSAYAAGAMPPGTFTTTMLPRTLAVYAGNSLPALSEVASASAPNVNFYYEPWLAPPAVGPSFNVQVTTGTTYQIVVDAPASLASGDDGTVVLTINQAPSIYSAAGASGMVGGSFVYSILASNNPTSYGAANLPPGVSINPFTGSLTGTPQAAGVYSIGLTATNPGGTATATLNLAVAAAAPAVAPTAPVINSSAMTSGTVGGQFSYYLGASGSPTGYAASGLPAGLSIDTTSGLISGTPTVAGDFTVQVAATNFAGTGSAGVTFHVAAAAHLPVLTSALAATGTVGSSFYYSISTAEVSNLDDPTSYSAANLPPGVGIDSTDGELEGTPTTPGVYSVPIAANNPAGTGSAVVTITINPAATLPAPLASPPLLTGSAAASAVVGTAFAYQLSATNAPTSFAASSLPPGLSLNSQNGYLTGTPLSTGVFHVPVAATNAYGTCNATLTISVAASAATSSTQVPLVITSAAEASSYVGGSVYYPLAATSATGGYYYFYYGSLTYAANNLPPGLSINTSYGAITGTPTKAGTYAAQVSATASNSYYTYPPQNVVGSAVVTFVIAGTAPPSPAAVPVFNCAASTTGTVGSSFPGFTASASGSPTSYAASGLPPGLSLNTTSGAISGTPTAAGSYPASFTAANNAGAGSATVTFLITAAPPASVPLLSGYATAQGSMGSAFSYSISASNSPTSFAAGSLPAGLSVNITSGSISGTPAAAGVYTVPISATNAAGTSSATLTITIAPGSTVPVISSSAVAHGTVGSAFSYTISASNSPTGYTASNLPAGLSVNAATGAISGTPTTSGVYTVPFSATNASGTGSATLTITLASAPAAPVFSGNAAASATVGAAFSYTLSASNSPAGYAATGLPDGLSVNPTSGAIAGTPVTAGVYTVPVSASNAGGTSNATLTITVAAAATAPQPPVVSSAASAAGFAGAPFTYTITATNTPTSYTLGSSLPPGLSFSTATGVLAGTPTAAGAYPLTIGANNAAGAGQATLTLVVASKPTAIPVISSAAGINGYSGQSFAYAITASNVPASFSAGNLPAGLTLNTTTGLISGTPATNGTYSVPVSAANAIGTSNATLTLKITSSNYGRITSPLAASGIKNSAFTYTVAADVSAYSYSVSALPAGLSFNASTHQITGTPTAIGTSAVMVTVSTYYATLNAIVSISIAASAPSTPVLTSSAGAAGYYGEPFYYALAATNNPTSYTVGALPAGLSFDTARNVISGTPGVSSGTYFVNIRASNAAGAGSGTLIIAVYPSAPTRVTSAAGAGGLVGSPFNYLLSANPGPYGYSYNASGLPPGLSFNTNTGQISGTPTVAGFFSVLLSVYSYSFGTVTGLLTLNVDAAPTAPPVFSNAAEAAGVVGAPLTYALAATNLPTQYAVGSLPAGLNFDASANVISGFPTTAGTFSVPLSATNAVGTGAGTLTLAIASAPSAPPVLASDGLAATAGVGSSGVFYQITATNSPTSYAAAGLPPGLGVDTGNGSISGTPATAGVYPATISAANAAGSSSAVVTFTVSGVAVPVFSSINAVYTGSVGSSFGQYLSSSNSPASYAASGLPPGLYLNSGSGEIYGAPATPGTYSATVSAVNAAGSDQATVTFVIGALSLPSFSSDSLAMSGTVGKSFSGSFDAGYAVSYTAGGLPPGLSFSYYPQSSGSFRGTPTATGTYPVTVTASNPGGTATEVITITIAAANTAPPLITSSAGASGSANTTFSYQIAANNSPASYAASGLPAGLQVNAATGLISGLPTAAGSYPVGISAANAAGTGGAFVTLQIAGAAPATTAPVITSAAAAYCGDDDEDPFEYLFDPNAGSFTYTITAFNGPTSFGAGNLPAGLSINAYTGVISGVPQVAGTFAVPISATNSAGAAQAVLTIIAPATTPVVQAALTVGGAVGSWFAYQISAGDEYEDIFFGIETPDTPTFLATGLPPGLSLNTASGGITGTPSQSGSFPVTLTLTNRAGASTAIVTFVIAAAAPPVVATVPTFSGNATALGFVNSPLSFYLSGTSASYSAGSLPAGLHLNTATGQITGTPAAAGNYTVPISTANSGGSANAVLTISILTAPDEPIIDSSAAASAMVGTFFGYSIYTGSTSYSPTPTSYGATNLPPGLAINTTNGYISGTPTQTGSYLVTISAACAAVTSQATLSLNVQPSPATPATPVAPVFGGPAGAVGFLSNPFVYPTSLNGFTPDGALPNGLSFDPSTGAISGYPISAGSFDVPLSATNAGGTGHAILNLPFVGPELSLPRIAVQPVGSTVAEDAAATLAAVAAGVPTPVYQWLHDSVAVPGAAASELDLNAVQPADAGTYVLTATNSSGSVTSAAVVLAVVQTYSAWQSNYFSPAEAAAGLAASGYDFNGDGLPNLLEYALDRNPRTGAGGNIPAVSKTGSVLQIQFNRDSGKTDMAYVIEASSNLSTWTSIAQSTAGGAMTNLGGAGTITEKQVGGGILSVTVQDGQQPNMGGSRFLRLRVIGELARSQRRMAIGSRKTVGLDPVDGN